MTTQISVDSASNLTSYQTFYLDANQTGGSSDTFITSIDLWFKSKPSVAFQNNYTLSSDYATPSSYANRIGGIGLGVIVELFELSPVTSGVWIQSLKNIEGSGSASTRVAASNINATSDASVATSFTFAKPIRVLTNKQYVVSITFEDPNFSLWKNKKGDKLVGTNTPSVGANSVRDSKFYQGLVSLQSDTSTADTDLKYRINGTKFTSNNTMIELVNADYEFFTVGSKTGTFRGGELVYQNTAISTGTLKIQAGNVNIIGTTTSFDADTQEGSYIAAFNGSNVNILKIVNVVNTTFIQVDSEPNFTNTVSTYALPPVGKLYYTDDIQNKMYLTGSNANTTNKFSTSSIIKGEVSGATANIVSIDDYSVDQFIPKLSNKTPLSGNLSISYALAYSNGSQYVIDTYNTLSVNGINEIKKYDGYILSRSHEVSNTYLYGTKRKSGIIKIGISVNGSSNSLYTSPVIDGVELDMFMMKNMINSNTNVTINAVSVDSEVYRNGTGTAKYISKKVTFANNRFAEDIRVYLSGYRPSGTDIKVYAKVHNSSDPEVFDDKVWTPLLATDNANTYSSSIDPNNIIEYTYSMPPYSESAETVTGNFTGQLGNTVLVATTGTPNTSIVANDIIKIYDPTIADNYMIAVVSSANTSSITLSQAISNNNFVGDGFQVDKVKYPTTAFNNPLNDNVCTYYTSSRAEFDKFNSMQVKIVLTSNNTYVIPKVDSIQVIGVSA